MCLDEHFREKSAFGKQTFEENFPYYSNPPLIPEPHFKQHTGNKCSICCSIFGRLKYVTPWSLLHVYTTFRD